MTQAWAAICGCTAARHVARRGGDARNHPRRLRADGRGPAAQLRPADGTAPASPHLGRATDRPGRRNSRRAGVPRCHWLTRLDQAIDKALTEDIYTDEINPPSSHS